MNDASDGVVEFTIASLNAMQRIELLDESIIKAGRLARERAFHLAIRSARKKRERQLRVAAFGVLPRILRRLFSPHRGRYPLATGPVLIRDEKSKM